MKVNKPILLFLVLILLLAFAWGYIFAVENQQKKKNKSLLDQSYVQEPFDITEIFDVQDEQPEIRPRKVSPKVTTDIKDWKVYVNDDLGFSFKYPPEFGDISTYISPELNTPKGEQPGKVILGQFENSDDILFGGRTNNYDTVPGQVSEFRYYGFLNNNGEYLAKTKDDMPGKQIFQKEVLGDHVLKVDCQSFEEYAKSKDYKNCPMIQIPTSDLGDSQDALQQKSETTWAGLINLSKSDFKNIILSIDTGKIDSEVADKIFRSITVL